jgi:hypothetical protein
MYPGCSMTNSLTFDGTIANVLMSYKGSMSHVFKASLVGHIVHAAEVDSLGFSLFSLEGFAQIFSRFCLYSDSNLFLAFMAIFTVTVSSDTLQSPIALSPHEGRPPHW